MKMKYSILGLLLLVVCVVNAQRKPKIKGSKVVVEVRENLEPFNAIELNDDLDIVLKKSSDFGYSLTIDDNLVDILKFRVVDNTLNISSFYKVGSKKKMEITVFYNELNSIILRDGKIESEDLMSTDVLAIHTLGSSKLKLNANANIINIEMVDNSFAELNVDADSLSISMKDRVDAKIYAISKSNTIEMFKNAKVKMEGNTDFFEIKLHESTSLSAEKLNATEVDLTIGDSSSAIINAMGTLNLSSVSSAKTYLYGGAKINIIDFLNTSQLIKKE